MIPRNVKQYAKELMVSSACMFACTCMWHSATVCILKLLLSAADVKSVKSCGFYDGSYYGFIIHYADELVISMVVCITVSLYSMLMNCWFQLLTCCILMKLTAALPVKDDYFLGATAGRPPLLSQTKEWFVTHPPPIKKALHTVQCGVRRLSQLHINLQGR